MDCLHSTSHARHRTSPTFIFHPCPTNDRLCSASSRINSLCVSSTVTYCYQSEQNRCRYHCVQEFHTQFDWFVCKHGPKLLNVAQNQSAGKPPRQQMGHIILHVFPRRLLPQQLPQQSSQFACVQINFNISFDIHTTGYNRAICSCKPWGLAKTYKMNGGKQKKNKNKMVGLCAPTSSLQHPHILLGGSYILPDVGCLPFPEYILCLHVWVLSPKKMHHFVGTWCCAICLRFFHSALGSLCGTTHLCNDM